MPHGAKIKVFGNAQVRDGNGHLQPADRVAPWPVCFISHESCELHRVQSRPFPARKQTWVTKLLNKTWNAGEIEPKESKSLVVVCSSFRYPVTTGLTLFKRWSAAPCCLCLDVRVPWLNNDPAKVRKYMLHINSFILEMGRRGTTAMDIRLTFMFDIALGGGEAYLQQAIGRNGLFSSNVKHVEVTIRVDEMARGRIWIYKFQGRREDGLEEFEGHTRRYEINVLASV